MRTATDLLRAYIAGPHDVATILELFADNGALEAPYFATFGMPWRFEGHAALTGTFRHLAQVYPDLQFENLHIICSTPDVAVGEYEFIATSARTGRKVHQLSVIEINAAAGRISLLREFQNIAEIALAIFPGGFSDVPVPGDRSLEIGAFS